MLYLFFVKHTLSADLDEVVHETEAIYKFVCIYVETIVTTEHNRDKGLYLLYTSLSKQML